jgi:hypothetical protein
MTSKKLGRVSDPGRSSYGKDTRLVADRSGEDGENCARNRSGRARVRRHFLGRRYGRSGVDEALRRNMC